MTANSPPGNYAGDLSPQDAWALLRSDPRAQLIDCRTEAEWSFVGVPDASSVGRTVHCVEWQSFPSMAQNAAFVNQVEQAIAGVSQDTPLLLLCRSGARSRAAAIALTAAGHTRAYNVATGFEGDVDPNRHRGQQNGWKAAGLPWKQT
jgi:rhodanese-related sulfurtransferase